MFVVSQCECRIRFPKIPFVSNVAFAIAYSSCECFLKASSHGRIANTIFIMQQMCCMGFNASVHMVQQECIPVGCVLPAHRLYLPGPGGGGGRGDIIID